MEQLSKATAAAVTQWLEWDPDTKTKAELEKLLADGDVQEVESRFLNRIKFGTAGLRGRMQAGPSSLNCLTVLQASQGLAHRVAKEFESGAAPVGVRKAVCIGRDGRHNSEVFSKIAAAAFLTLGIPVYFFPSIVPTPYVAFCVKHLNLAAGVMVTASHNPKDDNGYKVYWQAGSQIVPPIDAEIQSAILANLQPRENVTADYFDSYDGELLHKPFDEIGDAYFAQVLEKCCFYADKNKDAAGVPMVFTAMHGVGKDFVARSLKTFNLPPYIPVVEQIEADPDFSTVTFPNPEEGKGALLTHEQKLAIETAEKNNAPIIMANDPDSDRFAAAEKQANGEWKIFTGNELGILFANWTWQNYKRTHPGVDPSTCAVLNTTVSSKMLSALAEKEGLDYEETLTGFKWLGTRAQQKMADGKTFLFCFEEAIGYMIFDICLDKDGVRTAGMFAEMVNRLYEDKKTVVQQLEELYQQYGYFATKNKYFFCYDPAKMVGIFDRMRTLEDGNYAKKCGKFPIAAIRDLTTGYDSKQADNKAILPVSASSQMITFYFENGATVTLRGSGTEPKLKYYCELQGASRDAVEAELEELVAAIISEFLEPEKNDLKPPAS